MLKLEVFVADYSVSHTVIASLFITLDLYFSKAVVDELVHETIQKCWATISANSIRSLSVVKILFFNLGEFVRYKLVKYN